MIRFNIEPQLEQQWEPIIVRQLHLLLSPVLVNVKSASIKLQMQYDESSKLNYFYCELYGYGIQHEVFHASTKNTDGKVAIHDVFSRIRRTIIRSNQHITLGEKIVAISAKQSRASVFSDL